MTALLTFEEAAATQGFWDWTPHAFTEAAAESGIKPGQGEFPLP